MDRTDIPYIENPGQACALSCYTMVSKYFFPEATFQQIGEISRWEPGFVVWEMPFWNWIMEKGVSVTNYDVIDYSLWAKKGTTGLKETVPNEEFAYYQKHTNNLDSYTKDIQQLLKNNAYVQQQRNPTWDDLLKELGNGAVCTAVLDACALDNKEGFDLHQVVILDVTDKDIIFHDPRAKDKAKPHRIESIQHFKFAWLEKVSAPSLCAYKKAT